MAKLKITEITLSHILSCISHGLTIERACLSSGITPRTFYTYKNNQKAKGNKDFFDRLEKAEVGFELSHLKVITEAANGIKILTDTKTTTFADGSIKVETTTKQVLPIWQASCFLLERRFPERYSKNRVDTETRDNNQPLPFMSMNPETDIADPLAEVD